MQRLETRKDKRPARNIKSPIFYVIPLLSQAEVQLDDEAALFKDVSDKDVSIPLGNSSKKEFIKNPHLKEYRKFFMARDSEETSTTMLNSLPASTLYIGRGSRILKNLSTRKSIWISI
jgi:hypothetical protein